MNGRLYLGDWNNKIPNAEDGDNEEDFDRINLQGDIRLSGDPSNYNSGTLYGSLTETEGLRIHKITAAGTLEPHGNWDFSNCNVQNFPSQAYASITETDSKIVMTKPLDLAQVDSLELRGNFIMQRDNSIPLSFMGNLDFSQAQVTGLNHGSANYPSISESEQKITVSKYLGVH